MSEFSTESTVEILVEERSLRQARQEVEAAFEDVPVTVSNSSGSRPPEMRSDGSGGASGGRRSMRLAEAQTEHLEDAVYYLEEIEDHVAESGPGGGGLGGVGTELLGVGAETAGDVAVETGNTVADAVIDTVTTGVGNVIADVVPGGGGGSSGGGGEGDTLSPRITTDTELSPEFSPVFQPTFNPEFSPQFSPEFTPEIDVAPRVDISPQVDVSPRVDVSPELEVDFPDFNFGSDIQSPHPVEVVNWPTVSEGGAEGGAERGAFQRAGDTLDDAGADVTDFFLPGDAPDSISKSLNEGGTPSGRPAESLGRFIDTLNPITSGGYGSGGSSRTVTNDVDADVSPRFTINVEADRLIDDVEKVVERAQEEVRRELLDKIEDVQDDVDDLERQLTRSRR